jgi:hypothetical protein
MIIVSLQGGGFGFNHQHHHHQEENIHIWIQIQILVQGSYKVFHYYCGTWTNFMDPLGLSQYLGVVGNIKSNDFI